MTLLSILRHAKQGGAGKLLFVPTRSTVGAVIALLVLLCAFSCQAEPGVTAQCSSDNSFTLNATGLVNAISIEIVVGYDSSSLSNPVVSKGLFTARTQLDSVSEDGLVKISLSRPKNFPLAGSGTLANLKFSPTGDLPGKLTFISAYYLDREDHQINLPASIVNPADPVDPAGLSSNTSPAKSKLPQPRSTAGPRGAPQSSSQIPDPLLPTQESGLQSRREDAARAYLKIPSVLERFRESPASVPAHVLFQRENTEGIRQDPEVVLTDGRTPVTVTVQFDRSDDTVPNFYLDGLHLFKLSASAENKWVLTLLPEKGSYAARMIIVSDRSVVEFPLVVAPPVGELADDSPDYLRRYVAAANSLAASSGGVAGTDAE